MKYRKFFVVMLIMVLLSGLAALTAPILLQIWESNNVSLSYQNIFIIILIVIASKSLNVFLTIFREKFAKEFNKKNFLRMMSDMFGMDYDSIISRGPTNLLEKISIGVNSIYSHMTGGFIQIWSGIFIASICLILMACIRWELAAVMLIAIPINFLGYRLLNKSLAERSKQMQMDTSAGFQEIISYIQHVEYIKQLPDHKGLLSTMAQPAEKIYGSMARVNEYAQSMSIVLTGITDLIQTVIMLYLAYAFYGGNVGPYAFILSSLLLPLFFANVNTIVNANINKRDFQIATQLQKELVSCCEKDGNKTIGAIDSITLNVDGLELGEKKLPFHARGELKKGDIAQVCGVSGSGKSTFAKSLMKFRSVNGVCFNDSTLADIQNYSLRSRVEYIPQTVPIVCGSLRDNLLLNHSGGGISDNDLMGYSVLNSIFATKTLDDEILENGANLSGGEKQKIALVRALLEKPDVLILDEICSNIDVQASDQIYRYLDESRRERITFIITHDELPKGFANQFLNRS